MIGNAGHQVKETKQEQRVENELMTLYCCGRENKPRMTSRERNKKMHI